MTTTDETIEEVNLDKFLGVIWRRKWLILLGVLIAAGVAFGLGNRQQATYTAAGMLQVGKVWKEPIEDHYATKETINSAGFLHELAQKLGTEPDRLRRSLRAEVITAGPRRASYPVLIRIISTGHTPEEAVRFVEAAAEEIRARHDEIFQDAIAPHMEQQRRIEQRHSQLVQSSASRDLIAGLENELSEIKSRNLSPTVTERTHLISSVVAEPSAKQPMWRNVAAAAVIAALVGVAAALLIERFKSTEFNKADY